MNYMNKLRIFASSIIQSRYKDRKKVGRIKQYKRIKNKSYESKRLQIGNKWQI